MKRKRDDTDENEEADESENIQQAADIADDVIDLTNQDKDVVAADGDVSVPFTKAEFLEAATRTHLQVDGPPPRKRTRRRRIASVLAQTATAVTIGAVVTWSALAFS